MSIASHRRSRFSARTALLSFVLAPSACAIVSGLNEFELASDAEECTPGEIDACYSGLAGTEDVGICRGGTRTCDTEGRWRSCDGEVVPVDETCATDQDDDCDGQVNEAGPDCDCVPGSTRACYTGPMGTQGVGACQAGQLACNPDGNSYGPCEGQVLPAAEVCGTEEDEDCDGEGVYPDTDCVCAPGTTGSSCYTGPDGTEGVGACQPGLETCDSDGLGWSCAGEVVPVMENCATPADESCDGSGWYQDGDASCPP